MSTSLVPGNVFRWDKFEYRKFGKEIKPRWLILLGRTPLTAPEEIYYFCTTTTTYRMEEIDSERGITLYPPPFDIDCHLYFHEAIFSLNLIEIEQRKDNIELKGQLSDEIYKKIYFGYWSHRSIDKVRLTMIYNSIKNHRTDIQIPAPR